MRSVGLPSFLLALSDYILIIPRPFRFVNNFFELFLLFFRPFSTAPISPQSVRPFPVRARRTPRIPRSLLPYMFIPDAPIFLMSQNIFAAQSAARISPRIFPSVVAPFFLPRIFPRTPMPEYFSAARTPRYSAAHTAPFISARLHTRPRDPPHIKQGRFSRPFFSTSYISSLVLQNSSPVLHIVYSYLQTSSFYSSYSFFMVRGDFLAPLF